LSPTATPFVYRAGRDRMINVEIDEPFPFGYSRACSPDKFVPAV
jgi:hypothetical protein